MGAAPADGVLPLTSDEGPSSDVKPESKVKPPDSIGSRVDSTDGRQGGLGGTKRTIVRGKGEIIGTDLFRYKRKT